MGIIEAYLGLGSNVGDRERNLMATISLIKQKVELTHISSIYETDPLGYREQRKFLNCACSCRTNLPPKDLLGTLKEVEKRVGRKPTFKDGPRIIDIDLLFYGNEVLEESDIEIPHPRISGRAFVLVPLVEISPDLVHPVSKLSVMELLNKISPAKEQTGPFPCGISFWGHMAEAFDKT